MSLTEEIIDFLTREESLTLFCNKVEVSPDHLNTWLFDAINPNNINIFFDDGVVFKHNSEMWSVIAEKWREHIQCVMERRNQSHIDSLVGMSLSNNVPPILKNIANRMLGEIDNNPVATREKAVHGVFNSLFVPIIQEEALAQAQRDPSHVCENCTHCNIKRGECDRDIWWDISKVDIGKKYCEVFSLNTEKA